MRKDHCLTITISVYSTSEPTHMRKYHLFTIVISGYRTSVKNMELSSVVQHNASPESSSFRDEIVWSPVLSSNQLAFRIAPIREKH
ncbi:hypothetical protein TNCV_1683391 [Trichonephila clavipes]|nr:hypothetical protein TNCV_1683391 [Trichonephila clavipes]